MRLSTVMVLCWTLLMGASAMQVVIPGPCNETCNGSERTFTHDVVCGDADFNNTGQGRKYRDCVMCEHQSSSYLNPYATDLYWFLYNLKFALQTCIFTYQSNPGLSACSKSCDPLHAPLTARWIRGKHDFAKQYDYCNWNASALIGYGSGCADCLEKQDTTKVMANFMKTLITACDTKPNNTDGDTVELANGLFPASITTPTPSISASTTPKKSPSSNSADSSSSGLSDGAKAGIGVGVGVAGLCILGAITWFLTRRQHPAVSTRSDLSQLDSRPIAPPSFQPETSQASYYSDHGYSVDPSTGSRNKMNPAELQGYNSVAELPSDQRA